jgi:hypothetical protein
MSKHEEIAATMLAAMRGCFEGVGCNTPIDSQEWEGDNDMPGVKYFVISLLEDIEKKSYKTGYVDGAVASFKTFEGENPNLTFDVGDATFGSERSYEKRRLENK